MVVLAYLALLFAMLYGWVMNIVTIAQSGLLEVGLLEITGIMVLRLVGIFVFPLGSVLGYV
jgi:hypothetical protein